MQTGVATVKTLGLTNYSIKSQLEKLGDEGNKIIEKKYQSPRLSQMTDVEIYQAAEILILKIHVITGWIVPVKAIQDALIEQFYEKMKEDYSSLNIHEIEYAFRKMVGIQDWGKEMNLELIDKVLGTYLAKRADVSLIEQAIKETPATQKIYSDEEILNQRRAEIELKYQAMKRGKVLEIPSYLETVLREDGLVKEEETVSDFLVRCLNNQVENIYKKDE